MIFCTVLKSVFVPDQCEGVMSAADKKVAQVETFIEETLKPDLFSIYK